MSAYDQHANTGGDQQAEPVCSTRFVLRKEQDDEENDKEEEAVQGPLSQDGQGRATHQRRERSLGRLQEGSNPAQSDDARLQERVAQFEIVLWLVL